MGHPMNWSVSKFQTRMKFVSTRRKIIQTILYRIGITIERAKNSSIYHIQLSLEEPEKARKLSQGHIPSTSGFKGRGAGGQTPTTRVFDPLPISGVPFLLILNYF